jgi:hypothetical protein
VLLHILSNIALLPVTKSVVKDSGMGKVIASIEKHKLCAGTANETAIQLRVQLVKDSWNASVKARKSKEKDGVTEPKSTKRPSDAPPPPTLSKKLKVDDKSKDVKDGVSKPTAFSTLLNVITQEKSASGQSPAESPASEPILKKDGKKKAKRVKWSDHFGGDLTKSQVIEGDEAPEALAAHATEKTGSWSDRKKRDRLREKDLLAKAKYAKEL